MTSQTRFSLFSPVPDRSRDSALRTRRHGPVPQGPRRPSPSPPLSGSGRQRPPPIVSVGHTPRPWPGPPLPGCCGAPTRLVPPQHLTLEVSTWGVGPGPCLESVTRSGLFFVRVPLFREEKAPSVGGGRGDTGLGRRGRRSSRRLRRGRPPRSPGTEGAGAGSGAGWGGERRGRVRRDVDLAQSQPPDRPPPHSSRAGRGDAKGAPTLPLSCVFAARLPARPPRVSSPARRALHPPSPSPPSHIVTAQRLPPTRDPRPVVVRSDHSGTHHRTLPHTQGFPFVTRTLFNVWRVVCEEQNVFSRRLPSPVPPDRSRV